MYVPKFSRRLTVTTGRFSVLKTFSGSFRVALPQVSLSTVKTSVVTSPLITTTVETMSYVKKKKKGTTRLVPMIVTS